MKQDVLEVTEGSLPLPGGLINCLIGSFAEKPVEGDDSSAFCSIGVADNSVVATNRRVAILIGLDAKDYSATVRKEALIEAFRASKYGEPVRLDEIARNVSAATGEVKRLDEAKAVIDKTLPQMMPLASVNPNALIAIGKVALAAGGCLVNLFQPEGDPSALGFTFAFEPDEEFQTLFSSWDGLIEARGVFIVAGNSKNEDEEE